MRGGGRGGRPEEGGMVRGYVGVLRGAHRSQGRARNLLGVEVALVRALAATERLRVDGEDDRLGGGLGQAKARWASPEAQGNFLCCFFSLFCFCYLIGPIKIN